MYFLLKIEIFHCYVSLPEGDGMSAKGVVAFAPMTNSPQPKVSEEFCEVYLSNEKNPGVSLYRG